MLEPPECFLSVMYKTHSRDIIDLFAFQGMTMKRHPVVLKKLVFLILSSLWMIQAFAPPAYSTTPPIPVRVGSDHDYPPYEYNDENGNPTGFNVALIRAVLFASGLSADVKLGVWNDVRENLEAGKIDVIAGMYYSSEREKTLDFSVAHNRVSSALFVRAGSPITSFEQARGREIVVQKGDIMHDYLLEKGFTDHVIAVDDPVHALTLVASGKYGGVLLSSKVQGLYFINKLGLKDLRVVETHLPPRNYCFALKKGNDELLQKLNEGLGILKYSGQYQQLYDTWFGVYEEKPLWLTPRAYIITLAAILSLLAVISVISWVLRVQVKRRTRELLISEERYRHLVQNASDILYVTDKDGFILFINPIAETIIGYGADETKGRRFLEFIHPDHRKDVAAFYQKQHDEKIPGTYHEMPLQRKDGQVVWIGQNTQLLESEDTIIGFQAIARDITERKRIEEDLRKNRQFLSDIIEHSVALIFAKDRSGRYEMVNRKWEAVTGLSRQTCIGQTDEDLFPGYVGQQFRLNDLAVLESGNPTEKEEVFEDATGQRFFLSIKFPLRDGDHKIQGLCGMSTEITERKHAEQERLALQQRLQRAEKMEALGTLAGGVAHDLNNVLGILVGYSELLLGDIPEDSPLKNHAEKIMQGGVRAAAIVQDLLTLARRGVHSETVVNLNSLIRDFLKTPEYENLCSQHSRVRMVTDLSLDLLNIKGSKSHIFKTLMNLLTNAAEAISGSGVVTVSTENRHLDRPIQGYDSVREGDYVVLTVTDTGEGIADEDILHIFEPFYTKKVMGRSGTGLGLAVVWGTVKDHNGYIDVQSKLGKGTTMTLYFPVTRDEPEHSPQALPASDYAGSGQSILVVDDIKEQQDLAARMLGKLNYRVTTVSSGEEAVEYLKSNEADLVVLDMIMYPGMDGLDTYRRILETHPRQKAIIVSGYSSTDRVKEAQDLGAGTYVKKPYVMENLGLAVKRELEKAD